MQQVEWYMGRLNLEKDDYLKDKMDDDLWVSLDIILAFPKMKRMNVTDKSRVATLLHARSTVVEVDEKTARIRPAWARRSTLVIHDVPNNARLDQVAALFHIPSPNADLSNSTIPPPVSHPPGLISIQPAAETVWLAIFDSPTGAQNSFPLVNDKAINGQKISLEVHVESTLALKTPSDAYRQAQGQPALFSQSRSVSQESSAPSSSPAYSQVPPMMSSPMVNNSQLISPMGMPIPVIHHPSHEVHSQYPYAPPAGFVPQTYGPQGVSVPRQFITTPRAMAGYAMMAYPQAGPPFDSLHAVHPQTHPVSVQQTADQTCAPVMSSSAMPAESTAASGPKFPASVDASLSASQSTMNAERPNETEPSVDYIPDSSIQQTQGDGRGIPPPISFSGPSGIPMMSGQAMEPQMISTPVREELRATQGKAAMDPHYMHRGTMTADPNGQGSYGRGNGRQHQGGTGRDRNGQRGGNEGNVRTSGRGPGGSLESQGRVQSTRKGKKGNRGNNSRHGHRDGQHDRHADGRTRDGKGDGSGSDSGMRDDRRGSKDDKAKVEPNLASMHFPPLPVSETGMSRVASGQPRLSKKESKDGKESANVEAKGTSVVANGVAGVSSSKVEVAKPSSPGVVVEKEAGVGDVPDGNEKNVKDDSERETSEETTNCETVIGKTDIVGENSEVKLEGSAGVEEAKQVDASVGSNQNGGSLSYAAILRSKKPPSTRVSSANSRSSGDVSGKAGDGGSGGDIAGGGFGNGIDKNTRRKKGSTGRNGQGGDVSKDGVSGPGNGNGGKESGNWSSGSSVSEVKAVDVVEKDAAKAKPVVENSRAHPVWVNKPKSLFVWTNKQKGGTVAASTRGMAVQAGVDGKKVSSPVSSQGEEKEAVSENAGKSVSGKSSGGVQIVSDGDGGKGKSVESGLTSEDGARRKDLDGEKGQGEMRKEVRNVEEGNTQASAKGAWASGGPKQWPKNNGNAVMEKSNSISEC